jgi:hypothetical protein
MATVQTLTPRQGTSLGLECIETPQNNRKPGGRARLLVGSEGPPGSGLGLHVVHEVALCCCGAIMLCNEFSKSMSRPLYQTQISGDALHGSGRSKCTEGELPCLTVSSSRAAASVHT